VLGCANAQPFADRIVQIPDAERGRGNHLLLSMLAADPDALAGDQTRDCASADVDMIIV
jgi:hypothetical protein